jgi:ribosomal protein L7Ae-like RNA K-turn-binding protein
MVDSKTRKRKHHKVPHSIAQNESLELIASPVGPIRSAILTSTDKDILLQRLKIELLDKYKLLHEDNGIDCVLSRKLIKKYLVAGTNECTRSLEQARTSLGVMDENGKRLLPSLVMLARDVRPPTILAHIPHLCLKLDIPIILLPGKASADLGKVFNIKNVSALLFMHHDERDIPHLNKDLKVFSKRINSYIDFAISKISLPRKKRRGDEGTK